MFRRIAFILTAVMASFFSAHAESPQSIPVITLEDMIINPVTTEYILDAIDRAEQEKAPALIIELDTPGGLLSSTRIIVKRIMNAKVPIIVYVAPAGSRAGSAGVFITLAAHVAVMAPSTNIGAAHPVEFGESPKKEKESIRELIDELKKEKKKESEKEVSEKKEKPETAPASENPMEDKILNDTVAWVSTIAKTRGRNVDWAVKAVRESISSSEGEALKQGVVDIVAKDIDDLLRQAEGKKIQLEPNQEVTLHLEGIPIQRQGLSLRQQIMNVLINPNIAYLLMMLGFYGLLFEITHPGSWFPGLVGLIFLVLAFYAFHTLPTNYAGLALILLALVMFIAEVKVTSYGLLTLGGIICMLLGSLFLIDSAAHFMQISLQVILPVVVSTALIFFFLVSLAVRAQRKKAVTGLEGMIGLVGEVTMPLPHGKILVEGEIWDAISETPVEKGEKVRVVSVQGLMVTVEKI